MSCRRERISRWQDGSLPALQGRWDPCIADARLTTFRREQASQAAPVAAAAQQRIAAAVAELGELVSPPSPSPAAAHATQSWRRYLRATPSAAVRWASD